MLMLDLYGDLPPTRIIEIQRERAGLTQKQLGQMLDVAPSTINRWEHGKRSPSLGMFVKILRTTGADIQIITRG